VVLLDSSFGSDNKEVQATSNFSIQTI